MVEHYTIRGGIDSTAMYKEETEYAVVPTNFTSDVEHFGITQSITPTLSRSLVKIRGLTGELPDAFNKATSRDAQQILSGKSDLTISGEYQPQDFSFLKFVIGTMSDEGTEGIYYPQKVATTYADKKKYIKLPSMSVMQRFNFNGSGPDDAVLVFTGLKVDSWEITGAIGEPVSCNISLTGSNVKVDKTDIDTNYPLQPLKADDVYHFIDSDVKVGATSIPNLLDGFTLSVNNNLQGLGDLRSYVNEAVVAMGRDWQITINQNLESMINIEQLIGGDGTKVGKQGVIDSITILLDKGDGKNLKCVLVNLKQSEGLPGTTYGDITKDNITLEAEYGYFIENEIEGTTEPGTGSSNTDIQAVEDFETVVLISNEPNYTVQLDEALEITIEDFLNNLEMYIESTDGSTQTYTQTSPTTFSVTAEDGITLEDYTVTI